MALLTATLLSSLETSEENSVMDSGFHNRTSLNLDHLPQWLEIKRLGVFSFFWLSV